MQAAATEGKVPRNGFDLYYTIIGRDGPYALILSGGPGLNRSQSFSISSDSLNRRQQTGLSRHWREYMNAMTSV